MTIILILNIATLIILFTLYMTICELVYDPICDLVLWVSKLTIKPKFIRIMTSLIFGVVFGAIIYIHSINDYILINEDSIWGMLAGTMVGPFILPFDLYHDLTDNTM